MGMTWTDDQRKVIELRDRNILVSAAAGSGKTAVLVERIIKIITDKEHPVDIDRLLIVTFTNAAAAEMRERIGNALENALKEQPDDEHLQRQLSLLHNAQITTIDSFCLYVIRNYFHTIDLAPNFRIADEGEMKLLKQDIAHQIVEEYHRQKDPAFIRFADSYGNGNRGNGLEDMILKLYEYAIASPQPEKWLWSCADAYDMPDYEQAKALYTAIHQLIQDKVVISAYTLGFGGVAAAVSKMAFGNKLGAKIDSTVKAEDLFKTGEYGCMIAEVPADALDKVNVAYTLIGEVTEDGKFSYGDTVITEAEAVEAWKGTLERVFKTVSGEENEKPAKDELYHAENIYVCKHKVAKPRVFIPVFPGTNCEYDSAKAFERAGADTIVKVFKNLNAEDIRESVDEFTKAIDQAQIIMFPGGFSAGDEPDGSAKFFATAFRNAKMTEAVMKLLNERDGLALGICNGFQALIKLGLVPYGEIRPQAADSPTLTYNTIGRHISKMVYTKVVTDKSPWLAQAELGKVYCNPASHGEGRFVAPKEWLDKLFANGQVATQYVNEAGVPTMDEEWNVNGSYCSIEGITSPDGRVLGKMAHSERRDRSVAMNIYGEQDLKIFESGVAYFK